MQRIGWYKSGVSVGIYLVPILTFVAAFIFMVHSYLSPSPGSMWMRNVLPIVGMVASAAVVAIAIALIWRSGVRVNGEFVTVYTSGSVMRRRVTLCRDQVVDIRASWVDDRVLPKTSGAGYARKTIDASCRVFLSTTSGESVQIVGLVDGLVNDGRRRARIERKIARCRNAILGDRLQTSA
jgi:hypothetical protein